MVWRTLTTLILILGLGISCAAQDEQKQLSDRGITITYPQGMDSQAKNVMDAMQKSVAPALEIHKQIVATLGDPAETAKTITDLMGAEEAQDAARSRLATYKEKSEALIAAFSNIHLMKKTEAAAKGGVDAGVIQVRYSLEQDEFSVGLDLNSVDADRIKRSYFPVFVNSDGSVRSLDKLGDRAIDFLGSSKAMLAAPIHETAVYIMRDKLGLYHPFTRWFLEGVSGWVTMRVLSDDPQASAVANELFMPGDMAKKLSDKVNLLAWPQSAFQNQKAPFTDPALEVAQTQYAVEALSQLLGGNRGRTLARIIGEVKHSSDADTDTICEAIKKITGTDFRPALLARVPKNVKLGMETGEAKKLVAQAERLAAGKKWGDAISKLRLALQMAPTDVNARLNLAWMDREKGDRHDAEIQIFIVGRLLKQQDYKFHLFSTSVEGNYVLGRLAIFIGNLEYAKKFLEPVLAAKPDHQDAKRALEQIKHIEGAATGR